MQAVLLDNARIPSLSGVCVHLGTLRYLHLLPVMHYVEDLVGAVARFVAMRPGATASEAWQEEKMIPTSQLLDVLLVVMPL